MSINAELERGAARIHHHTRVRYIVARHTTVRSESRQRAKELEEGIIALVRHAESTSGHILTSLYATYQ